MERFSLDWVARSIGAKAPGAPGATGVSTDTRTLRPGEVYFALRGERFDGAAFVPAAFARGASACVVGPGFAGDAPSGRALLRVDDPGRALLALAGCWRRELGVPVVAVTGSAGKTTTKELLAAMLGARRRTVAAPKSFNNAVGVPLTLLTADRATEVVVLEVGTSAPGEIATLAAVARPDVAVITCIGAAHLGGLGGVEGVAREKLSLLDHLAPGGAAVLNTDDPRLRAAAAARAAAGVAVSACGLGGGEAPAAAAAWRGELAGAGARSRLTVSCARSPDLVLELPQPGRAFALDVLLALAAAARLGVEPAAAGAALARFAAPPGRWAVREVAGVTLIDDAYNANPTSVRASLASFAAVGSSARRVAVLGGMRELGAEAPALHRAIGAELARVGVRRLVAVGEEARALAEGARAAGLAAVSEVADAAGVAAALGTLSAGDAVWFKASRAYRLEEAVRATAERLEAGGRAAA